MKLNPGIAPIQVAVFPLLRNKPELVDKAKSIYQTLRKTDLRVAWDDRGNIGKRYLAQDEIGTPWCITIDGQSMKDQTVTLRDRDSLNQERVPIEECAELLTERLL